MTRHFIPYLVLFPLVFSCNNGEENQTEQWKQEILETESNFQNMLQEKGFQTAFVAFADSNAVLIRGSQLIKGKDAIANYYKDQSSKGLSWKVEFIDVSKSGDLAYTYGQYTFNYKDAEGKPLVDTGIFNTVWKRQADGGWKYVKD